MKKNIFLSAMAVLLILTTLFSSSLYSAKAAPVVESEKTSYENRSLGFPLSLLKECAKSGENVLISPLCASTSLTAAALGASENTRAQLENVLTSGSDLSEYAAWVGSVLSGSDCALSLWVSNDGRLELSEDYAKQVKSTLSADIFVSDFSNAADSMNSWVQSATDGKISSIVEDIPPEAVMYILSALTFDGEWKMPYTSENISEGEFTSSDGTVYSAEFMMSTENIYLENELSTGFAKQYTDGSSFVALLPNEGTSISELIASLDSESFDSLMSSAQQKNVRCALPKFTAENKLSLSDAVIAMGAPDAFSSKDADFSALGAKNGNVYISDFLHNCYLNVDESGTQGGAASGIEVSIKSAPSDSVILNRPFVYFIVKNGEFLFAGILEKM